MISIILPVYNCGEALAENLPGLVDLLQGLAYAYKIIIVDDCSAAGEVIEQAAKKHRCMYIRNERNEGKGYTVRKGAEQADGDYLIFMDGDFPFDLQVMPRMVTALLAGSTDMVIGDRTLGESSYPDNLPWLRKAGSRFLSAFTGRYITPGYCDTQCGIKGFTPGCAAYIFPQLTQRRFSFDIEILFLATRKKLVIKKIPVMVRNQQQSTVRVWKDGIDIMRSLITIYSNKLSGKYSF